VSINTLKTLANNGKIKSFKTTGKPGRFRQDDLDAYMGVEEEKVYFFEPLEKEISVEDMQKIVDANEKLVKELKDGTNTISKQEVSNCLC
jgi:predicted site-specific integrase-resolvase